MIKYLDNHLCNSVVWKISSFVKNEKKKGQTKIKLSSKPFSEKLKYHLTCLGKVIEVDYKELSKTLDFNTFQGFFFFSFLYMVIPACVNHFIYKIMKWNIAKIENHNYEVLNQQEY